MTVTGCVSAFLEYIHNISIHLSIYIYITYIYIYTYKTFFSIHIFCILYHSALGNNIIGNPTTYNNHCYKILKFCEP